MNFTTLTPECGRIKHPVSGPDETQGPSPLQGRDLAVESVQAGGPQRRRSARPVPSLNSVIREVTHQVRRICQDAILLHFPSH